MVLKGNVSDHTGYAAHQAVWESLPWYVNGTLEPEELAGVEKHVSNCVTCRAELHYLGQLGRLVHGSEDYVPSASRGLKAVLSRIDRGRPSSGTPRGSFWAIFQRTPLTLRWTLLGQTAFILVLLSLFLRPPQTRVDGPYRTLSDMETTQAAPAVLTRVVFDDQSSEGEIRELLLSVGGEIIHGPSPIGAYTLKLGTSLDPSAVAKELRSRPIVRFAEPIARTRGQSP